MPVHSGWHSCSPVRLAVKSLELYAKLSNTHTWHITSGKPQPSVLSVAVHEMAFDDSIGLWNVLCGCEQSLANVACQMAADVAHLVRLQPWNWHLARLIAASLLCAFLMLLQWRV